MESEDTASIGMEVDNMESKLDSTAVLPDSAGAKVTNKNGICSICSEPLMEMSSQQHYRKFHDRTRVTSNAVAKTKPKIQDEMENNPMAHKQQTRSN